MVHKGEFVIAHDPDLHDMYCCEVVRGDEENLRNLLCRVIYMIRYPIQHAVFDGGVPNENPPFKAGEVCRLKYTRRCEKGEETAQSYDVSFARCLDAYVMKRSRMRILGSRTPEACRQIPLPSSEEFEILKRHQTRDFRARRATINH